MLLTCKRVGSHQSHPMPRAGTYSTPLGTLSSFSSALRNCDAASRTTALAASFGDALLVLMW